MPRLVFLTPKKSRQLGLEKGDIRPGIYGARAFRRLFDKAMENKAMHAGLMMAERIERLNMGGVLSNDSCLLLALCSRGQESVYSEKIGGYVQPLLKITCYPSERGWQWKMDARSFYHGTPRIVSQGVLSDPKSVMDAALLEIVRHSSSISVN